MFGKLSLIEVLGPCSIAYNPLACVTFPVYALPVVIGPVSLGGALYRHMWLQLAFKPVLKACELECWQ